MIENTKDLNMVADRLRARGEISRLQELCRERLIPENDMQDFLQGKRLRLAEVPLEEKKFSTASEKIAEEMYQFEGPGLAVALGQYLLERCENEILSAQILLPHKSLEKGINFILQRVYEESKDYLQQNRNGQNGAGVAVSSEKVYHWLEEYYALDDAEEERKELKIVALDGHRISLRKVKLKKEYEPQKVIVPGKNLAEMIKIIGGDPEKEVAVYFTENHIQFEIENTRAISRLIEGEYLKVEQLLSKDYGTKIKVQKKELQECIDRAGLLLKDDTKKPIISVCMGHNGTGVTKDVYINLPEEIYDCEKVIGNFIIDILPQTDFVFDIQISEKDLLELLPQKVYNTVG